MECIRDKPAHGLLFQATLEELAEFPDEEMEVDVVGKGETPLAKKAAFPAQRLGLGRFRTLRLGAWTTNSATNSFSTTEKLTFWSPKIGGLGLFVFFLWNIGWFLGSMFIFKRVHFFDRRIYKASLHHWKP